MGLGSSQELREEHAAPRVVVLQKGYGVTLAERRPGPDEEQSERLSVRVVLASSQEIETHIRRKEPVVRQAVTR